MSDPRIVVRSSTYGHQYGRVDLDVEGRKFAITCRMCGAPDWRTEPCKHEIALYDAAIAEAAKS